jgi:hypothetical protein
LDEFAPESQVLVPVDPHLQLVVWVCTCWTTLCMRSVISSFLRVSYLSFVLLSRRCPNAGAAIYGPMPRCS